MGLQAAVATEGADGVGEEFEGAEELDVAVGGDFELEGVFGVDGDPGFEDELPAGVELAGGPGGGLWIEFVGFAEDAFAAADAHGVFGDPVEGAGLGGVFELLEGGDDAAVGQVDAGAFFECVGKTLVVYVFDGGEIGKDCVGVAGRCCGGGDAPGEEMGDLWWCRCVGGDCERVFEAGHEAQDVAPAFYEFEDGWRGFVVGCGVGEFVFEIEVCVYGAGRMRLRPCL